MEILAPTRPKRLGRAAPAAIIAAALVLAPGAAAARRQGIDIEATKGDETVVKGELVAVRTATMVVREIPAGGYLFLDIADIVLVRIPKTSRTRGMWSGLIQGTFTGGIAGDVFSPKGASSAEHWLWILAGGAAGGGLGALLGRSVAVPTGEYETLKLQGRPLGEVDAILTRLRAAARIPDVR